MSPLAAARYAITQPPTAPPFNPLDLGTRLRLWLDPSNPAAVIASAGLVSQLSDLSGQASHRTNAVAAEQPSTGVATIGGRNAIRFVEGRSLSCLAGHSGDGLMNGHGYTSAAALYVMQRDADASPSQYGQAVLSLWSAGPDDHEPYTDGTVYSAWGSTVRYMVGNPAASFTTARQITIHSAPGAWSYSIDGAAVYTSATNTVGWGAVYNFVRLSGGAVGEVLVIADPTPAELTGARGYLRGRWGTP